MDRMTGRHAAALVGSAVLVFGLLIAGIVVALRVNPLPQAAVIGAVLTENTDPAKQTPISGVSITGSVGATRLDARSDSAGFFRLTLPVTARLGHSVSLTFRRAGYAPKDVDLAPSDKLSVVRLQPLVKAAKAQHAVSSSNIRIRYTVKISSFVDVGSVVQTFEVRNKGNVPCRGQLPCSPSGDWKAATQEIRLDAHEGNHFRNPSVSCIAGPCPFTRIETEDLRNNGRIFVVSALNWSDTATFLVEADVVHDQLSDMVREAFPVIFGRSFTFTLPPSAEGPSVQAEVDGQILVFPLGPELILSWAECASKSDSDRSQTYSCELKPEYRFS